MIYAIILHLDAPLQSWGTNSKFQLRSAGFAPSKSAICGMVCAACGAPKESPQESEIITWFSMAKMDCFCMKGGGIMVDYHTIQNYRRADGSLAKGKTVISQRHYWQNSRFNVILSSEDRNFLARIHAAIQNPVWGIWFGRKCCIPAAPIIQEPIMVYADAREKASVGSYESFSEVDDFESGTDTWFDQPVGLGKRTSSGREGRAYAPRRINHDYSLDGGDQADFFHF